MSYATVVAFRHGFRGVHYIVKKEKFKFKGKISIYKRLWKETENTIEVALYLKNQFPNLKITVDFDFNEDDKYESFKLVYSSTGWAKGLGFNVNVKPTTLLACKAADHECRR